MPIVNPDAEILRHFGQVLRRLKRPVNWLLSDRRRRPRAGSRWRIIGFLLHWRENRRATQVGGIRTPFAFRDFDRNQTSQTLLLARSTQSWILAADGDCRRGDWILRHACTGAAECCLHRLNIVVVPPATVGVVSFLVFASRCIARPSALVPCVLLPSSAVAFHSLALALSWISLAVYWLGLSTITLRASMVRLTGFWTLAFSMRIPRNRRMLGASLLVASLIVGGD